MSVSLQAADSAIEMAEQVQAKNVLRIHLGISISARQLRMPCFT